MIVNVDMMKEALGLPLTPNASTDPVMERSSKAAQALVERYIGTRIEQDYDVPQFYTKLHERGIQTVRLPHFPATLWTVTLDGVDIPVDQFDFNERLGVFEFRSQRAYINKLEIKYVEGYLFEFVPQDLIDVTLHLSLSLYENQGQLATATTSTAGALKSLTMFDAMSMSFETGGGTTQVANQVTGPEALPAQWDFVLRKYKVDLGFG